MPTAAFDPHPTLGALEIGAFISIFLFGIVTVQVYLYFRHFPKDNNVLKAVASVFSDLMVKLHVSNPFCRSGWIYLVNPQFGTFPMTELDRRL